MISNNFNYCIILLFSNLRIDRNYKKLSNSISANASLTCKKMAFPIDLPQPQPVVPEPRTLIEPGRERPSQRRPESARFTRNGLPKTPMSRLTPVKAELVFTLAPAPKKRGGLYNCGRWKFVERWQKKSKSRSLWDCFSPRQCHGRVLLWSLLHDSSKSKSRDDCSKVTVESRCWLVRVDECTKVFPFLSFVLWLWGW